MVLTTKSTTPKSRFKKPLSREEKIALNHKLADRARDMLEHFGLKYADYESYISTTCPIHDGADNPSAFSICTDSDDDMYGLWRCWTRGCEQSYSHDMLGLIHALMEVSQKAKIRFPDVIEFAINFTETSAEQLKQYANNSEHNVFDKFVKAVEKKKKDSSTKISRENVRKSLTRPAKYYIDRGFTEKVLD
ncbi:hypothetical protein CL634_07715, partial [bacterium]|nr:hypothetical protein [bacterium]